MYEKGYVMVSIYDMATVDENGNMTPGEILLPEGKIPFVLSEDDVCYYHYMDGDGSHPNWSWMMTVRYAMNISKMMEAFQWETMM